MGNAELEKSRAYKLVDLLEYLPDSIVIHPVFIKNTGNISVISYDAGVTKVQKKSPFDAIIQVIEGEAEIIIDDQSHLLETGHIIIIPAHSTNTILAKERFKMLSTIIKSGYEDEHI
jgi:quercetin dioxygenase-like cupin family protein